jgi:rhamnose transport system permease protein
MAERRGIEVAVAALLGLELLAFSLLGPRFWSWENGAELVRAATELGLVALAMTAVMKSGGIDLSVGGVMGLAAVCLGLGLGAGLGGAAAAALALLAGALCGAMNGLCIAGRNLPPLLVTLATMALARGLAEGLSGGYAAWSSFPAEIAFIGQGEVLPGVPVQALILGGAFAVAQVVLHHTPFGRRLEAIGYSPEAARYAGIRCGRALVITYTTAGAAAAAAGLVFVARVGQAKADAGTAFELAAISVAVLGGTSIHGGRGTVLGTALALGAIVVLQNGFIHAGLPSELGAASLAGVLLAAVAMQRALDRGAAIWSSRAHGPTGLRMKNAHVAILAAAILVAGVLVALGNHLTLRAVAHELRQERTAAAPVPARRTVVAMMPKSKGDPYFVSCRQGAEAAAQELGVELLWDGPTDTDAARQNEVIDAWTARGVDVLAVSVENKEAISTALRRARGRGVAVVTWDADALPDARDFLVNQATAEGIGHALADEAARVLGGEGSLAIVTATLTAANQNEWIRHIRARIAAVHPRLTVAVVRPSDGQRDKALTETKSLLHAYPDVRLIVAIAAPAVPGAAEAVRQLGSKVKVIGLSTPNLCREYVHAGIVESIVLWNTVDLGYLTVHAAHALRAGTLRPGVRELAAGRLGRIEVRGDEVLLGTPFRFDRENIDRFDF